MFRHRQRHDGRRGIAFARILLLLLAWSQFSLAAHHFDHSIENIDESCAVCLQLERSDDAPPPAAASDGVRTVTHSVFAIESPVFVRGAFTSYQSRASP